MIFPIQTNLVRTLSRRTLLASALLVLPLLSFNAWAQAPARLMGTITAINGKAISVKPDTGDAKSVDVPETAIIKRIAPGERDLSKADLLPFSGLAVGDRVLVKLDASSATPLALQIIAIKQEDVAQKQQHDREDWQKRGVGGLVKSIDPATSVITISSGFNGSAKLITIHLAKNTVLRRYAPASVNYESARPAPVDAIHPGDQLRARGAKSADGLSLDAEEIVSGSFRNISGVISAIDPAAGTISLKDLASKKQVTLQIPQEAQLHRLPEFLSRMISAKLKGANGAAASPHTTEAEASHSTHSGSNGAADPQQALSHLPQLKITDLKKGDAIMAVTTDGTEKVTTITLLAGVEALLEAPAAQDLLSSWSMGGGEASGQ